MIVSRFGRFPASAILVFLLSGTACKNRGPLTVIRSIDDMRPDAQPGKTADLVLAGTAYPVTLRQTRNAGRVELDLISHGEVLESERYEIGSQSFSLLDAAEEHFLPALPLLRFPLTIGENWTWTGTMTTGRIPRPATASVAISTADLFAGGASHDTVKAMVDLSFEANPGRAPLKRQLSFWFDPNDGLIQREFGTASVRQPPKT